MEKLNQDNTGTSNFWVKTDYFNRRYYLQFSKDLRSLVAYVAEEGGKESPEANLSDTVWCDSLCLFLVQQLMERNSSEMGSGSMEDPKKMEYSWSVTNCIQRGQSTEEDLAFKRERITGKLLGGY